MTSRNGLAIGLFGGSFNPAHAGHLHVAEAGLRELDLDQVWWLVSPQNPLKPAQPPATERAETINALGLPYGMHISHIESFYKTRYTVDFIEKLLSRNPDKRFVYIIGADNLGQMQRWKNWRRLFDLVPIAVISRPGTSLRARLSPVARQLSQYRLPEQQAHALKSMPPPCWTYLTLPLNPLSSSAIRAARNRDPS